MKAFGKTVRNVQTSNEGWRVAVKSLSQDKHRVEGSLRQSHEEVMFLNSEKKEVGTPILGGEGAISRHRIRIQVFPRGESRKGQVCDQGIVAAEARAGSACRLTQS